MASCVTGPIAALQGDWMGHRSGYRSHLPDAGGHIHWRDDEHANWQALVARQRACLPGKACDEYLQGLDLLALPPDRIPQLDEVSTVLQRATGWSVAPVPALISFDAFFDHLANRRFPVATFIRSREDFDYLQEPDIFHEIFGHCPLLTHPAFAHFTEKYGQLGLAASPEERVYLARLYWFTVEFGLIDTPQGLRIYGGGVLSSPGETQYALGEVPERKPLEIVDALRTPYRIDIMQPVYFVIDAMERLFEIAETDLMARVAEARRLGLHPPKFAPKEEVVNQ